MHYLKKLQPIVVLVSAFVALFAGVGFLLPIENATRVQVVFKKDIEDVFKNVTEIEVWPQWFEAYDSAQRRADLHGKPVFHTRGERGEVDLVVERLEEPHQMVLYLKDGSFEGRWFFDIELCRAGTLLTITEVGAVSNPLVRGLTAFEDKHVPIREFMLALGAFYELRTLPDDVDVEYEDMQPRLPK